MQRDRSFRPLEHIVRNRRSARRAPTRYDEKKSLRAACQPSGPCGEATTKKRARRFFLVFSSSSLSHLPNAGSLTGNLKVGKNKVEGMNLKDRGAAVL